jgi:hypothetical protein
LRELKRWARLAVQLCSRGWEVSHAVRTAFDNIYILPQSHEGFREAAEVAFQSFIRQDALPSNERQPWFTTGLWPLTLSVSAFTENATGATIVRDMAPLLHRMGQAAALWRGPLRTALIEGRALAQSVLMPGTGMSQALTCGVGGTPCDLDAGQHAQHLRYAVTCIFAAAHVAGERGLSQGLAPAYTAWASDLLHQLRDTATGVYGGNSSLPELCEDAGRLLRQLMGHPLLGAPSHTARVDAIHHNLQTAVVLQRVSDSILDKDVIAATTLLELSCWRSTKPKDRARVKVPHPAVDWLWPVLQAVHRLEETVLGSMQEWSSLVHSQASTACLFFLLVI